MTTVVRRVLKAGLLVMVLVATLAAGWLAGRLGFGSVIDPESLPRAERAFSERMRNVVLVGSFTDARRADRPARSDRYEIESVEKVGDDLWRFNARMDCCGLDDSTLPIVVPMRWHGDTPMIMMTDTGVPGLGTFTVRVLFYRDWYAGTWQRGDAGGGLMYGRIEKRHTRATE